MTCSISCSPLSYRCTDLCIAVLKRPFYLLLNVLPLARPLLPPKKLALNNCFASASGSCLTLSLTPFRIVYTSSTLSEDAKKVFSRVFYCSLCFSVSWLACSRANLRMSSCLIKQQQKRSLTYWSHATNSVQTRCSVVRTNTIM